MRVPSRLPEGNLNPRGGDLTPLRPNRLYQIFREGLGTQPAPPFYTSSETGMRRWRMTIVVLLAKILIRPVHSTVPLTVRIPRQPITVAVVLGRMPQQRLVIGGRQRPERRQRSRCACRLVIAASPPVVHGRAAVTLSATTTAASTAPRVAQLPL